MMGSLHKKYLSEMCKVNYGKSPKGVLSEEGVYPVVGTGGIEKYANEYLYDGESIVLGRKGTIDKPTYIKDKFWVIDTAFYLSDFLDVDVKFLHYSFLLKNLRALNESTGVPSVSRDNLYRLDFLLPESKLEQARIAEILITADEAIAQTEALIAKYQHIKTGLMQDLLTRGIDANGNIRSKATHKFVVKSGIEVPEEWEVKALSEVVTILVSNVDKKTIGNEEKVWLCNYMDVYSNREISKDISFMEATASIPEIQKYSLQVEDVIITKDSESPDDIAIPAVVKETFKNLICGYHLAILRPNEDLDGYFLMYQLLQNNAKKHFGSLATGSTRYSLALSSIEILKIVFPDRKEQEKIIQTIMATDVLIESQKSHFTKLHSLKTGLMQDLLSGWVRMKVNNE